MSNGLRPRVGVLGATGAVGSTILEVLAEREFPAAEVVPLASERSAGKRVPFAGSELEVRALSDESIQGLDLVLSSAGGAVSSEWAPRMVDAGAVVVDNTSFWRMHDDVPLVVAEVNPDALAGHRGLVANPNCTTMQMMVALEPIQREAGIERLVVSTYQSVSGTGRRGDRGAARADPGRPRRRAAGRRGLSAPDRLQRAAPGRDVQGRRRLHDRGAQGDGRDAEDPRRRRRGRDLGDLCRVPVVTGHSISVNVETSATSRRTSAASSSRRRRASSSSTLPARASTRCPVTRGGVTRSSSAASAATPRTSAASTSGSSATTCARVRRPTPSRSPSCSSSAIARSRARLGVPAPRCPDA